tara:strand:- start:16147 stop:16464 length:318 start_codon:yes stop_codon:yes gene_type:complete
MDRIIKEDANGYPHIFEDLGRITVRFKDDPEDYFVHRIHRTGYKPHGEEFVEVIFGRFDCPFGSRSLPEDLANRWMLGKIVLLDGPKKSGRSLNTDCPSQEGGEG